MTEENYFCNECSKAMVKKHGNLTLKYDEKTEYEVINVIHYACEECGSRIIPREYTERVEIADFSITVLRLLEKEDTGKLDLLQIAEKTDVDIKFINKTAQALAKNNKINLDNEKSVPVLSVSKKKWDWQKFFGR